MVMAQVLDLQTGRSADLSNEPTVSIDAGVVIGDADYIGTRGNFKVTDKMLLMADVGVTDIGDDELALGLDAMYQISVNSKLPVALKFGAAFIPDAEDDFAEMSFLVIISGDFDEKFGWYANGGVIWVDREHPKKADDDDILATMGGGLEYVATDTVELFAGIDILLGDIYDDVVIGGGVRLNL